jgi:EAL and modified HD-GYP domain-containing signal transduction protein
VLRKAVAGLLSILRALFTANKAVSATPDAQEALRHLNQVAPVERTEVSSADGGRARPDTAGEASGEQAATLLCRSPILDRSQEIVGYEFRLHSGASEGLRIGNKYVDRLMTEVLLRNISELDLSGLLGQRIALVPIPDWMLWNPLVPQLPRRGCVLSIVASGEHVDIAALATQMVRLRNAGYRLALDGEWEGDRSAPLAAEASYVFIDATRYAPPDLRRRVAATAKDHSSIKIIGKAIDSFDHFALCRSSGCDLFQGTFITSREDWSGNSIGPSLAQTFTVLKRLREESTTAALVDALKHDPVLPYRLLRFANSAAAGSQADIHSLEEALLFLGRDRLYRWASLVLFSSVSSRLGAAAILEHALVRARLMELLAQDAFAPEERNHLFMVGLFSLLDQLLEIPLEKIVSQLGLTDEVARALLTAEGSYAPYLELALACEGTEPDRLAALAEICGIDLQNVGSKHLQALQWAQGEHV